jgi:hypothetical protein
MGGLGQRTPDARTTRPHRKSPRGPTSPPGHSRESGNLRYRAKPTHNLSPQRKLGPNAQPPPPVRPAPWVPACAGMTRGGLPPRGVPQPLPQSSSPGPTRGPSRPRPSLDGRVKPGHDGGEARGSPNRPQSAPFSLDGRSWRVAPDEGGQHAPMPQHPPGHSRESGKSPFPADPTHRTNPKQRFPPARE